MKKFLMLAILAGAAFSAYAQVKVNDANNISISHSGGNLELNGTVLLKNPGTGALEDKVLTIDSDGRIRSVTRAQLLDGLTGNYLPLSGGTLTGNLAGTTALFSGNVGIGASSSAYRLNIVGTGSTSATGGLLVKNSEGKQGLEVLDDATVKIGHKLGGYSPSQHVSLNFMEADGGPNLYIGRDQNSGSTGYPWASINIGDLGYQNGHAINIGSAVNLSKRTVIYQPVSSSAIGNNGGAFSIIRNQNSGNFGFGIDSAYRGYIQNYHIGNYYDLLLNPQGGYVGVNNVAPTAALDVTGKAKVSEAPTDPTEVVRLVDLQNALAGVTGNVDSTKFIRNQNTAAQAANFWTSGVFRMDGRLGLNNAAAGPWVLDVSTGQYAYRVTSSQQDLYGQLVSASGRAELGVMQDALYLQSTSELANGINLIDNSDAIHTFRSGRLGVNNQNPAETLDVNGTGKFSGNVSFAGNIHSAANSNLTVSAIGGNGRLLLSSSDGVKVDLRDTGEGEFVVQNPSGALFSVISATKEVLIGESGVGNAYLRPMASLPSGWAGSNLHITGGKGDNGGGNLYLYGGEKQTTGNAGNTILAHTGSASLGKVGIGTNAPTEILHVAGKALVTQAPTDPDGVVRLSDLQGAISGINLANYVDVYTDQAGMGGAKNWVASHSWTSPGYELGINPGLAQIRGKNGDLSSMVAPESVMLTDSTEGMEQSVSMAIRNTTYQNNGYTLQVSVPDLTQNSNIEFPNKSGVLAMDLDVVHSNGNETIYGLKTFGSKVDAPYFYSTAPAYGFYAHGTMFRSQLNDSTLVLSRHMSGTGAARLAYNSLTFTVGSQAIKLTPASSVGADRLQILQDLDGTLALTVQETDYEITSSSRGVILKSPNGTRWRVTISDAGVLTTTSL